MPVRKRANRKRSSEVAAWSGYFQSGCDFFNDLAAVGLTEEAADELAEATWRRIGAEIIDYIDDLHQGYFPAPRPYWAEEQFGDPRKRRR